MLLVLLALVTALIVPGETAPTATANDPGTVQTASPGCGDEDDGPGRHGEPSAAVRPASAEPGRPGSVRLPRTLTRVLAPALPAPATEPRAATPVAAAGGDGRAPGAGLLITLRVSRT
ncbi:hypothetical protein EBO15_37375 [Actinomadura harenae]|uniref:Secreted protein n=1 Tax=Actinomadura harenae TaxID=2483351 RepID=A0A3M2LHI6_9ACTN|nr:hypothetical protein EBO15_37375 [Actinomadura harenae]